MIQDLLRDIRIFTLNFCAFDILICTFKINLLSSYLWVWLMQLTKH